MQNIFFILKKIQAKKKNILHFRHILPILHFAVYRRFMQKFFYIFSQFQVKTLLQRE
jgi:hypothetical protein